MTDTVEAIEAALRQREWVPTGNEQDLGGEFLLRRGELQKHPRPAMPVRPEPWGPWTTQYLAWLTDLVGMADALVDQWRSRCPSGSPIVTLLRSYVAPARPFGPLAHHMERAWLADPPVLPTADEVVHHAERHGCSRMEAERTLGDRAVKAWEDGCLPVAARRQIDDVTRSMINTGSVLATAVIGDAGR
ncbi:hypothetical protein [Streptomyces syringium]|uniref:Uncharacterized protein n=1 Tax=Streptomyces syringium TaxID=76729 RepID=A0ABS4XVW6_9ACTN|nr:hypothetical protein [Streptomyces syringium]MBP2400642.1 hypothetical protein [Streptomyces syringium]